MQTIPSPGDRVTYRVKPLPAVTAFELRVRGTPHQQHIRKCHRLVATYPSYTGGTRQRPEQPVVWKWVADVPPGERDEER